MQTIHNYYEVLGIPRDATGEEIKKTFRRLARQFHPDVNPGNKTAEETFKDINEAYDILSDEIKRADYDQQLFGKGRRKTKQTPLVILMAALQIIARKKILGNLKIMLPVQQNAPKSLLLSVPTVETLKPN